MDPFILIGLVFLYLVHLAVAERRLLVSERREKAYLEIIKRLENRLSAKDLTGYMALEDSAKHREQASLPRDPTPEEEAYLAAMRGGNGYVQ